MSLATTPPPSDPGPQFRTVEVPYVLLIALLRQTELNGVMFSQAELEAINLAEVHVEWFRQETVNGPIYSVKLYEGLSVKDEW